MARKARKKKAGRKGRRGAGRKAAKSKKRKSSKRSAAARKGARTKARHKAERAAAGRKGARKAKRSGKRSSGKRKAREMAMEPRKTKKRKGGKRKGSRKGSSKRRVKRQDLTTQLTNAKARIATLEARYAAKHLALQQRIVKSAGAERERLIVLLNKLKIEQGKEINRIKVQSAAKLARLEAAEGRRRGGKSRKSGRKGKRRGARRNPIGSGSGYEHLATAAGVLAGIVFTVLPYRMIRSHALLPQGAVATGSDQPNQGDVHNLLVGQLPLWSRLKWKGLLALGTVLVVDIALPFTAAAMIESSDSWKVFFQMWGWTGATLGTTKLVVDVAGLATKNTLIGQRLFAPENTARDVRVQSAAAQLPAVMVQPGLGLPGLTGYGRAQAGCPHVGAGSACCAACAGAMGKRVPPGSPQGTGLPITGTTPMPAAPGVPAQVDANPGSPSNYMVGATGAQVTPINKFAPKSRFDSKRLSGR